ncbi:porin [Caballeronia sp. SEWSISQ10-4 2]|uniref:porin n=1 Tax=Caballeronia sp. SEWSISQ10-4 2 TaxID=2937438 RepID=UPI002656DBA2|nr:porin [Caballeronia sp. SEWSISQ10-4 2]MDN7179446.1 porin [Caballeronia sp. SEWSISQ10-4 2]
MEKTIPAIRAIRNAVGGACTLAVTFAGAPTAHADSLVTLYGITDASILYTSKTFNLTTGASEGHQFSVQSAGVNASRFGLRGTEDLGGGLATIFDLESGIDISNGGFANSNGEFFGRQAWVGITGGFGTLTAGLQYSPFLLSVDANDPRDFKQFGSGLVTYVDNVIVTGLFNPNSVMYTSPEIAGIQGRAMYAFGGSPGNFKAGQQYSAGLVFHYSGLLLTAAMYNGNSGGSAAAIPNPSTIAFSGRNIGATYYFDRLTVDAAYTLYKVAGSFDNRVISGGLAYKLTPALSLNGGAWYTRDGNDSNNHSILGSLGVDYSLSKRTTLYSQVAYVNNHGRTNTGLAINGALFGVSGSQFAADLGIRHSF